MAQVNDNRINKSPHLSSVVVTPKNYKPIVVAPPERRVFIAEHKPIPIRVVWFAEADPAENIVQTNVNSSPPATAESDPPGKLSRNKKRKLKYKALAADKPEEYKLSRRQIKDANKFTKPIPHIRSQLFHWNSTFQNN